MNFEKLNFLYIGLLKSCALGLIEIDQNKKTNYHRIEMTRMDWILDNDEEIMANAIRIQYPQAKSHWGILSHFGIFDSLKKGKLLAIGNLHQKIKVDKNMIMNFDPGRMTIDLAVFELETI